MQDRTGFIGGSDAKRILDGDWHSLYLEKIGEREPEDLSHKFNVQLGVHTEPFHIEWLNKHHSFNIWVPPNPYHHFVHTKLRAQIDGWCQERKTFVEVKHTNSFATRETMLAWYQPQIAHYCNVMDVDHGYLSFIAGNNDPDYFKVTPAQSYLDELLEHELRFWWHVENRVPPDIIPNASLARTVDLAAKVKVDDMRSVDMTSSNAWASSAIDYIANEAGAAAFDKAKKALKELVEADVRQASGHGITIKRNKAGSLLISVTAQEAAE